MLFVDLVVVRGRGCGRWHEDDQTFRKSRVSLVDESFDFIDVDGVGHS